MFWEKTSSDFVLPVGPPLGGSTGEGTAGLAVEVRKEGGISSRGSVLGRALPPW